MAQHHPPMLAAHLNKMPSVRMIVVLLFIIYAYCILLLSFPSSATDVPASAQATSETGQKLWCVAKPSTPDNTLQSNLDFACGEGGADCTQLAPGCSCFYPNTLISHASYAMNSYYQKHGRNYWNCYFQDTGLVVFNDPSYENCIYPPQ